MAPSDTDSWETEKSTIESNDVIIRGERMSEVIDDASIAGMVYTGRAGKCASPGQVKVLAAPFGFRQVARMMCLPSLHLGKAN
jgi:hypothetical protein